MKAPAFQFYAGDYFIDTFLWSNRELGAYTRLLSFEWTNGPLPNDPKKLAKIAVESPENMAKIWNEIGVKFDEIDGNFLVNSRLEETRQKQINYAESRRKGAIAKHDKFVHMQNSCSDTMTGLCNDSPSPSPTPTQKNKILKKEKPQVVKSQRNIIPPEKEWIEKYCRERNNGIDAQSFLDYYTNTKWRIGKPPGYPMVDWESAIRNWEKRNNKDNPSKPIITDDYVAIELAKIKGVKSE